MIYVNSPPSTNNNNSNNNRLSGPLKQTQWSSSTTNHLRDAMLPSAVVMNLFLVGIFLIFFWTYNKLLAEPPIRRRFAASEWLYYPANGAPFFGLFVGPYIVYIFMILACKNHSGVSYVRPSCCIIFYDFVYDYSPGYIHLVGRRRGQVWRDITLSLYIHKSMVQNTTFHSVGLKIWIDTPPWKVCHPSFWSGLVAWPRELLGANDEWWSASSP